MKRLVSSVWLCLALTIGYSQNGIKARLVDSTNEAPIVGANVILFGTTSGAKSDADGSFALESIATNRCEIIITDATEAYVPVILANINFGTRNEINLGAIGMIKKSEPVGNQTSKCLTLDGKKYQAQLMDGGFRYIPGQVAIIFMDKQSVCE